MKERKNGEQAVDPRIEEVRNFLCSYQFSFDMLNLHRYERRRARVHFDEEYECNDLMAGDEKLWEARMCDVRTLISSLRDGREKLILYYHYIRGMSVEHAADMIGVSRRTGYRMHKRGLLLCSFLYENMKKNHKIRGLIQGARE